MNFEASKKRCIENVMLNAVPFPQHANESVIKRAEIFVNLLYNSLKI